MSKIDQALEHARNNIDRVAPEDFSDELFSGAIAVDIRPQAQRRLEGTLPGALIIERNVLEWRLDPTSDAKIGAAQNTDVRWIIVCSEGYTSSLAAYSLRQLGIHRATDLVGGYRGIRHRLPTLWRQVAV